MAEVVLDKIYKQFPSQSGAKNQAVNVLRGIDLQIRDGEFMVLVGPSGCGKSTLLRILAGLETQTAGSITVGDRTIHTLPPKDRDIAMVFQSYALYPHLTVFDNIAFGLRRSITHPNTKAALNHWGREWLGAATRSLPAALRYQSDQERQVAARVQAVAQQLQIEELLTRLPKQLSGGQKQRVALGRAIARNPQVFLMDEPLSNLDAKLRNETRAQIVQLQRSLGITTIYVTHDQTEAMTMGDRIAVMNGGELQQIAPPLELYNNPANRFVAEFIGSPPMNFLPVQISAPSTLVLGQFRYTLPPEWGDRLASYGGHTLLLGIRPEHLHLSPAATKNIAVKVELVEALGNDTYLTAHLMEFPQAPIRIRIPPDHPVQLGDVLWFAIAPDKIHFFDPKTHQRLC
ncbi:ABC transporter ATP-binding protein [Spirulina major]|uniref:ABC transporter ATP-binding protein n=1 Tax=Spirulina major TaxID=270636 RepID=UPI00093293FC|nr:ABC transporter ATP-binding protein [Spirulina major]